MSFDFISVLSMALPIQVNPALAVLVRGVIAAFLVQGAVLVSLAAGQGDPAPVGQVTKVQNLAEVTSSMGTAPAMLGTPVHTSDELRTGEEARLQVTFDDGTVLTLGANATVTINAFVYAPDRGAGEALFRTTRGAFRFATGKIGELKTKSIVVSTPVATVGVRGTEFWGGPIDEKYGVLLFEGEVEVANGAGHVILAGRGEGTSILSDAEPPSAPKPWPADKIARALATVALR